MARHHCPMSFAALMALALLATTAEARDLQSMRSDEITVLQKRLTDAGCYRGPLDGTPSKATADAVKACPDQEPDLRIETGMHTGVIRHVAADAACRIIATGSDDKTVRVWSMPDGKLQKVLRMPVGPGGEGKAFAVGVSPDGRYVAAGGWDAAWSHLNGHYLYLHDLATGGLRRYGPYESTLKALTFAPNGRDIAMVLGGSAGARIVDRTTGKLMLTDKDYQGDAYGVSYGPDGTLYTSGLDGFVRRYSPDYRRTAKVKSALGRQPFAVSADPQGRRVVVGYLDQPKASLLDPVSLAEAGTLDTGGASGNFFANVWRPDGGQILLGGGVSMKVGNDYRWLLRPLTPEGRRDGADIPVALDAIMDAQPCGRNIVFAAADPSFGIIENGKVRLLGTKSTADMRDKIGDAMTTSSDGRLVRFGLGDRAINPVLFDLSAATLDTAKDALGLSQPLVTGLNVTDWQNSLAPKLNGQPIALDNTESSRALAIRPDRSGFVLGGEYTVRSFDASGKQRWRVDGPGVAWGVNLAQGGNLVEVVYGDGTLRWYRWSDGAALLTLFIDAPSKRWVAWTPSGYYMAAPGGEDLIGWHLNRGWDQTPDFFSAARFRDKFSRPDVVQRVLETLDEAKAVDAANAASRKKPDVVQPITAQLPPVITISGPKGGDSFNGTEVTITYLVRSPSGQPVDKIDALIDGRPATENRGLGRLDGQKPSDEARQITLTVPQKDVEVALIARSGGLVSEAAKVRLAYAGKAAVPPAGGGADLLKPKLYALVIGVADYDDASLKLGLSAKDARDFAAAIKAQQGALYGGVEVKLLTDKDATRNAILDGLEWMEKQVTSRDVGMLFLAGHGINDEKQTFWFLPVDATPDRLRQRGVSHDDIRRTLQALAGKSILFLDACHAGRAASAMVATRGSTDINAVVNDFSSAENGVVTFASSTGKELSQENPEWGNGAFTKALIEGIGQGKADLLGTGSITLSQLDAFVVNRVKDLTKGTQHSVMTRPPTIVDFPIAIARK